MMTNRFRPQLSALEAREVPAALSFVLPDGTVGSGLFSTPDGVGAGHHAQALLLADLTVSLGGVAYTVQSGATATYLNGVLTGVTATATATGRDTISLSAATATVGTSTAPVAYDAADTQATFTLPDGTTGALSYAIPWDQVDSTQTSQSLTPTSFNLNIAGQNFTYGYASYTTAPTLQFANGVLHAVTFALDSSSAQDFPYTSFSATLDGSDNNVITAVEADVGPLQPVMLVQQAQAVFNFNTGANDTKNTVLPAGTRIRIRVEVEGLNPYDYDATTIAGETVGNIAQQVYQNMKAFGLNVTLSEDGRSVIVDGKTVTQNGVQSLKPVTKAGINYSTAAQPLGPKAAGDVQLLILDNGTWKPKP